MRTTHPIIIATCILVGISSTGIANAMIEPPIMTLQADKDNYQAGGMIKISGLVANDLAQENPNVLIRVFAPDGSLYNSTVVSLKKVENPTQNFYVYGFEYSYDLKLDNAVTGDYEIIASNYSEKYLTKWVVKLVTFQGGSLNPDDWHAFEMPSLGSNETHQIKYKVSSNVRLETMAYSGHQIYATVTTTPNGGSFIIQIPRTLSDSKYDNGTDRTFGVAMGGYGGGVGSTDNFKEIESNADYRTLQVILPQTNSIEIIMISGWQAVPEFPFAIPVFLASTMLFVVFTKIKKK